jgi:hypothetical protein
MADDTTEYLKNIALTTLIDVAQNEKAPAAARGAAARTIMEAIGAIGRNQDLSRLDESKRSASEMTLDAVQKEISRLMGKVPAVKMKKVKI